MKINLNDTRNKRNKRSGIKSMKEFKTYGNYLWWTKYAKEINFDEIGGIKSHFAKELDFGGRDAKGKNNFTNQRFCKRK